MQRLILVNSPGGALMASLRIARWLEKYGVKTATLHSNRSQNQRLRALADFKSGAVRVLDYKTSDSPVSPRAAHLRAPRRDETPRRGQPRNVLVALEDTHKECDGRCGHRHCRAGERLPGSPSRLGSRRHSGLCSPRYGG